MFDDGPAASCGFLFEVDLVDWMGGSQLNRRWSAYDRTLYFRVESSVMMGIAAVCVSVFWNAWVCSRETRHLYLSCLLTSKPGRISAPRGSTCDAENSRDHEIRRQVSILGCGLNDTTRPAAHLHTTNTDDQKESRRREGPGDTSIIHYKSCV